MRIDRMDHLVLTVTDIAAAVAFYSHVLGMEHVRFGERHAVRFGSTKINLHELGREFEPKAARPTADAGDLCFVTHERIEQIAAQLADAHVPIEEGPVARTGALGPMRSIYIRDPDASLIEIATYETAGSTEAPTEI